MKQKKLTRISIVLLSTVLLPFHALAFSFIPDQQALQGDTVQLLIPKLDFTEATGSFEGKTIKFYEVTKAVDTSTPMTRAEFIQLIYLNSPEGKSSLTERPLKHSQPTEPLKPLNPPINFADVPNSSQFITAINFATSAGLISGYEDGLFHPLDSITRAQAAKILINYYHPAKILDNTIAFSDIPLNYSLRKDLYTAVEAGILKGYPDGKMLPDRPIKFLEANLILQRASHLSDPVKINQEQYLRAFLGIHRLSDLGPKNLHIEIKNSDEKIISQDSKITVTKQNFGSQHFDLAEDRNKLFGQEYQDKTWALIDAAKSTTSPQQLWEGAFIYPTTGRLTTNFGDKMYINGKYDGSHFGLDIANSEGTDILASNNGIVAMASDTAAYGNTIVIDHGQNVFTMYLHNSALKVKAGDFVHKGDVIAAMGSTGLANGSHLHFTNFVGDIVVNPNAWFQGKY